MSTTQEYYIRKASETEARGPFNTEQLISLAENNQADPDTYFYDAATEAWSPISGNAALMETLFPTKKVLRVKPKSAADVKNLNTVGDNDKAITVDDILLAAEGRTEDTKDKADPAISQSRAAAIGGYACLGILVITAAAYTLPYIDLITKLDTDGILANPIIILGVFNLILALCVGLGATNTYPLVRFAAMLGFGFAGTLYYFEGESTLLLLSAASAVGLYLCTILLNMPAVLLFAVIGLLGSLGIAQHTFTN
jgi:hypothetical protein